jgi:serine protease Do
MINLMGDVSMSRTSVLGGLLAVALLGGTALTGLTASTFPFVDAKAETVLNHAPAEGFADLVEKVMPAVISVEVKFANVANMSEDGQARIPGLDDLPQNSPFRRFFEQFPDFRNSPQMPMPRDRQAVGEGSGFVISADGYAVTNNHVVKDADEVMVKTNDGKEY